MLRKHHPNALDRRDDPVGGSPFFHLDEQRRHGFAPGVPVGHLQDRFVGDDLGAMLGHREIDEDAGTAGGTTLRSRLENGNRAAADTPVLCSGRRQREPERHPFEDQQGHGELQRSEEHQQGQQLAERRLGPPSAEEEIVPPDERSRTPGGPGKDRKQRDQGPVQADVVIGIADRRRDGDDLAIAVGLGRRDRRRDLLAVVISQVHHQLPPAPPPPNDPPPPEKPPPPPPQPPPPLQPPPPHEPPREPRLSSFRPQRTTQGLMPPPRDR